jgi:CDP-glucose 4,6-dehydratase
VLLTGHSGFKGSWLAHWLLRLGADVTGFALAPDTEPSLCQEAGLERRIRALRGDVRDAPALAAAMAQARPDIVFHLAAQPLVGRGYAEPAATFATNVLGTVHLLEALRAQPGVAGAVIVTSDKCYANRETDAAYAETDALGGRDPYSASKACAELAVAAWRHSYFAQTPTAIATARAGNVIGGGDWATARLVPDCVRGFAAGRTVSIRRPRATRPWQHVLDPLCGYLLLAERLCRHGDGAAAWNFGPDPAQARDVGHVAGRLAEYWGKGAGWTEDAGPYPHEAARLAVDSSAARRELGWRPRLALEPSLGWTVRWYRRHAAGADAARLMDADIARYMALAPA